MCNQEQFITGVVDQYPQELLRNRLTVEGNLIACLFADPSLFDDLKNVGEDNFVSRHGRLLFGVVKYLREKGFNVIDEVTILSNCPEEVLDRLKSVGGWKTIQKLASTVDLKNWDAIFDAFNKSNIILKLHRNGFNLLDKIKIDGTVIRPIDLFSGPEANSQFVLNWYEDFLVGMSLNNTSVSNKIISDSPSIIGRDFIERLKKQKEENDNEDELDIKKKSKFSFATAGQNINGETISMLPYLSNFIDGLKRKTTSAIAAHSGCGKTMLMVNIVFALLANGLSGVFVSNEMSRDELHTMILLVVLTRQLDYWKITKKKLTNGDMTDEEWKKLDEAQAWWDNNYGKRLDIVDMSDADSSVTYDIIKKKAIRKNIDFFVVDTLKLTIEDGRNDSPWMNLIKDSRGLDSLAKKYEMIGLYSIQLAPASVGVLFPDASALANGKQSKEVLSNLIMLRKAYREEFDNGGPYDFEPFRTMKNDDGTSSDVRQVISDEDKAKTWRVVIIDKCRSGADSGDTGVGFLYKLTGDFCKWGEPYKVRPKHKRIGQDTNAR